MKKRLWAAAFAALGFALVSASAAKNDPNQAIFTHTKLTSAHRFDAETPTISSDTAYINPILGGFYPDPSILRVDNDYYLINSTFSYFPGIPIFHSTDLVHWTQIGNAIDRPSQLNFSGLGMSRGVFAPAISYANGTFYIVNTCVDCGGNFVITAKDPKGPWSDPVWFPDIDGIDPSLFHDSDGKSYIINNGPPEGVPLYGGHRAIWIQEFDRKALKNIGPRKLIINGGVDLAKKPVWIEGPHIQKVGDYYYLTAAEGGTSENHSQVVFRSKSVWGPYEPYDKNPILTQRDLDPQRPNPITSAGHAQLVQTKDGHWWAAFLATRPYGDDHYNTGRETFLLPVKWVDGWPVILDQGQSIPYVVPSQNGMGASKKFAWTTTSDGRNRLEWLHVRSPKAEYLPRISDKEIVLNLSEGQPFGDVNAIPAFAGLRLRHNSATFETTMIFATDIEKSRGGVIAMQNDDYYAFCGVMRLNGRDQGVYMRRAGKNEPRDGIIIEEVPMHNSPYGMKIKLEINKGLLTCKVGNHVVARDRDATFLSTKSAGGFVGTVIGVHAYRPN